MKLFAGIDAGSQTFGYAILDKGLRITALREFTSYYVQRNPKELINEVLKYKPISIALPSGHGICGKDFNSLSQEDLAFSLIANPNAEGPLRNFLRLAKLYKHLNVLTIPSVIQLKSIPKYRKYNKIDMGTSDKVASAIAVIHYVSSSLRIEPKEVNAILLELGSYFSSILVIKNGKIVNSYSGTSGLKGFMCPGPIDGEVAYLFSKYYKITKKTIYEKGKIDEGEWMKALKEDIMEKLTNYRDSLIVATGRNKDFALELGLKDVIWYPYEKASAIGAAIIASSQFLSSTSWVKDVIECEGRPIDYVMLEGWEEVIKGFESSVSIQ